MRLPSVWSSVVLELAWEVVGQFPSEAWLSGPHVVVPLRRLCLHALCSCWQLCLHYTLAWLPHRQVPTQSRSHSVPPQPCGPCTARRWS